jgi:hypothetical protein
MSNNINRNLPSKSNDLTSPGIQRLRSTMGSSTSDRGDDGSRISESASDSLVKDNKGQDQVQPVISSVPNSYTTPSSSAFASYTSSNLPQEQQRQRHMEIAASYKPQQQHNEIDSTEKAEKIEFQLTQEDEDYIRQVTAMNCSKAIDVTGSLSQRINNGSTNDHHDVIEIISVSRSAKKATSVAVNNENDSNRHAPSSSPKKRYRRIYISLRSRSSSRRRQRSRSRSRDRRPPPPPPRYLTESRSSPSDRYRSRSPSYDIYRSRSPRYRYRSLSRPPSPLYLYRRPSSPDCFRSVYNGRSRSPSRSRYRSPSPGYRSYDNRSLSPFYRRGYHSRSPSPYYRHRSRSPSHERLRSRSPLPGRPRKRRYSNSEDEYWRPHKRVQSTQSTTNDENIENKGDKLIHKDPISLSKSITTATASSSTTFTTTSTFNTKADSYTSSFLSDLNPTHNNKNNNSNNAIIVFRFDISI